MISDAMLEWIVAKYDAVTFTRFSYSGSTDATVESFTSRDLARELLAARREIERVKRTHFPLTPVGWHD